jgi:hypothetical protein
MSKGKPKGGKPATMSISKHRKIGNAGKSPKRRLAERMAAEADERKPKKGPTLVGSIRQLFNKGPET